MTRKYDLTIKPVTYNGVRYRSSLEVTWVKFFDSLGVLYMYEPETFKTRHGFYKPDFYLPHLEMYVEIKPSKPTTIELEKGQDVCSKTLKRFLFQVGTPAEMWEIYDEIGENYFDVGGFENNNVGFTTCSECGNVVVGMYLDGDYSGCCKNNSKNYAWDCPKMHEAIKYACPKWNRMECENFHERTISKFS
jgi:hypothetical protein